jgi:hypothetical protein
MPGVAARLAVRAVLSGGGNVLGGARPGTSFAAEHCVLCALATVAGLLLLGVVFGLGAEAFLSLLGLGTRRLERHD